MAILTRGQKFAGIYPHENLLRRDFTDLRCSIRAWQTLILFDFIQPGQSHLLPAVLTKI
jgi:hypothetical protein